MGVVKEGSLEGSERRPNTSAAKENLQLNLEDPTAYKKTDSVRLDPDITVFFAEENP